MVSSRSRERFRERRGKRRTGARWSLFSPRLLDLFRISSARGQSFFDALSSARDRRAVRGRRRGECTRGRFLSLFLGEKTQRRTFPPAGRWLPASTREERPGPCPGPRRLCLPRPRRGHDLFFRGERGKGESECFSSIGGGSVRHRVVEANEETRHGNPFKSERSPRRLSVKLGREHSSFSSSLSLSNWKNRKESERRWKKAVSSSSERTGFVVRAGSRARRDFFKGGDARLPVLVLDALAQGQGRGRGELR